MKTLTESSGLAGWAVVGSACALLAACATPSAPPPAPATPAPPAAAAPATPPAPQPAKPAVPDLPPAQAKAQAQKHAIDAVDQLQNGDEGAARQSIEQALALDATNELARNLRDQIQADAQKELGGVFFRYTVQRDDSLSKLAQQFLGDRFKFYILAKYNDIPNPSRLAAGQVIRIPGKAPPVAPAPPPMARPPAPVPEPAARAPDSDMQQADIKAIVARGMQLQKNGDLEGAYAAYNDALRRDANNREALTQRDVVKQNLIRRYEREAVQAFQRQNLDAAIARWNSVLELDPINQKARLERERAVDLKRRAEKFGG